MKPIEWDNGANPYTIGGDLSWSNYTVSADARIQQAGAVQLLGRVTTQAGFNPSGIDDYYLQVSDTGAWSIVKNTTGAQLTTLASGTTTAPGTGTWHHLALSFDGSTITASLDGTRLGSVTDTSYAAGQVGLGVDGYQIDQFDNLSVTPIGTPTYDTVYQLTDRATGTALAVAGDSPNAAVVTAAPADTATQQWEAVAVSPGENELVNVATGRALDLPGRRPGTPLRQAAVSGASGERWQLGTNGAGYQTLTAVGRAADAAGPRHSGASVVGSVVTGAASEQWSLGTVPVVGATYTLHNQQTGDVMDVNGQSTTPGAQVIQWEQNGGANQSWTLSAGPDGTYTLVNGNSHQVLDVNGASTAAGAVLVQEPAAGTADQEWRFQETGKDSYLIVNVGSGLAVTNGDSTTEGVQLSQATPASADSGQTWALVPTS